MQILNSYIWYARIYPAFLLLMPVVIYAAFWFPELQSKGGLFISLGSYLGVLFLLANLSRDSGKKKEILLFSEWGGIPSTMLLRHRNNVIGPVTKARYHRFLEENIEGLSIPTPAMEYSDPSTADQVYLSATTWLRTQTRDINKHSMVFQENTNYGFRRNMWGIRNYGITLSLLTCMANFFHLYLHFSGHLISNSLVLGFISTIIALLIAIFWIFWVTSEWVKTPAFAYAEELIACCDSHDIVNNPLISSSGMLGVGN